MIARLVTENYRAFDDAIWRGCVIIGLLSIVILLAMLTSEIAVANTWRAEAMRETPSKDRAECGGQSEHSSTSD